MAARTEFGLKPQDRDFSLELVQLFPPVSIGSDEQLIETQKIMDGLLAPVWSSLCAYCFLPSVQRGRFTAGPQFRAPNRRVATRTRLM